LRLLLAIETLKIGGAENFVRNLAAGLSVKNKVYLLITSCNYGDKKFEIPGVRIFHPFRSSLFGERYSSVLQKFQFVIQLVQFRIIVFVYRIELIHSHLYYTDFKIFKFLGRKKLPWVIGMHGCYEYYLGLNMHENESDQINTYHFSRIVQILGRADFVALASVKNQRVFGKVKNIPMNAVYNSGLRQGEVYERLSLFQNRNKIRFCMVSRGIESKGWEIGIQAFIDYINRSPNVIADLFLIYSVSEYMSHLEDKYSSYHNIHFLGPKYNIVSEMTKMDVLIFPSYFPSESQPYTIIEALAAQLPVIASSIGEIPRMLNCEGNASGFCVDLGTDGKPRVSEFLRFMIELTRNDALYSSMVLACKTNFAPFSMARCVNSYEQLYTKLISEINSD
jgi:glycosyltransferase involved in cell wall biosynthesis